MRIRRKLQHNLLHETSWSSSQNPGTYNDRTGCRQRNQGEWNWLPVTIVSVAMTFSLPGKKYNRNSVALISLTSAYKTSNPVSTLLETSEMIHLPRFFLLSSYSITIQESTSSTIDIALFETPQPQSTLKKKKWLSSEKKEPPHWAWLFHRQLDAGMGMEFPSQEISRGASDATATQTRLLELRRCDGAATRGESLRFLTADVVIELFHIVLKYSISK